MIGKKAPTFSCQAVLQGAIKEVTLDSFHDYYKVLVFYPGDFTFICPTELHAFQNQLPAFKQRNVQIIGCSVDSVDSHKDWLKTPKKKGGIQGISFPLLADINKEITRDYGVLDEQQGVAYRGVFIIDKDNVVQSLLINNLSLGRNIDEILRIIDALQYVEQQGKACPANWTIGQPGLEPNEQGLLDFFKDA